MNIFVLDKDHAKCAEYHPDQHQKMILESFQLLSSSHRIIDGDDAPVEAYAISHRNHPCSIFARLTADNYMWLFEHAKALMEEFKYRTGKVHLSWQKLGHVLSTPPRGLTKTGLTAHCQCMPDHYKVEGNAVQAYRNYFNGEKQVLQNRPAEWKTRSVPHWFQSINFA
jgi:hypothetical protein